MFSGSEHITSCVMPLLATQAAFQIPVEIAQRSSSLEALGARALRQTLASKGPRHTMHQGD